MDKPKQQRQPEHAEEGQTDQAGDTSVQETHQAGPGTGRLAVSEVWVVQGPANPSQDQKKPSGERLAGKPGDALRVLPSGRARAAFLFSSDGDNVPKAKTTQEVKIPLARASGLNCLRWLANVDARGPEAGAVVHEHSAHNE